MDWLKLPAWKVRDRGFEPRSGIQVSKKEIVSSLLTRKDSIVWVEVASSTSDHQGSSFESCVWRAVASHSSHHPQEFLLVRFSLYVHKSGPKPHSFHIVRGASHNYRARDRNNGDTSKHYEMLIRFECGVSVVDDGSHSKTNS